MRRFEIRQVPVHEAAVVRITCKPDEIGSVMGPAFGTVAEAVMQAGGTPTGPAFARYHTVGPESFEFDCGMVVAARFSGDGNVQAAQLGGCEVVFGRHVGPYDTIGETWEAMTTWAAQQGRALGGPGWESYITDPAHEPDPANWVTEVFLPLA
jgi:effector-binding domain-containing protein